MVVIGLVLSPPGFLPGLVHPPPPPDASAAAAARAAAAFLRLASAAAARFLQQQLGLELSTPVLVRRTWATPGGRVAAHISLPSPMAAQALARKRWRLRGTAFTVDLLRDPVELAQQRAHLLAADGRWGVMEEQRWAAFLDWLSDNGLLTTKVQSRTAQDGLTTTLDGLRRGDAGEPIPRESVPAASLFTNEFLP